MQLDGDKLRGGKARGGREGRKGKAGFCQGFFDDEQATGGGGEIVVAGIVLPLLLFAAKAKSK